MREPPAAEKVAGGPSRRGYIRLRAARDLRRSALSLKRDVCSFRNGATREKKRPPGRPQVEEKCERHKTHHGLLLREPDRNQWPAGANGPKARKSA
jgi:hypothetical protein